MRIALTAFTRQGGALARALFRALGEEGHTCSLACPRRLEEALAFPEVYERVGDWAGARFADSDALLFVGASGIAVRAIAPYVRDKLTDPAVVSVDEAGRFAVPLLSGHVGGANDLARRVAALTGGEAAVSTATDVNGRFAVDQWAREQGFCLEGRPFQPHITLVRRWQGKAPQVTVPHASMVVRRISLLRSDLTDGKRIYTELSHTSLR